MLPENIIVKIISDPDDEHIGKEIKYSKNANPEEVFHGLALMKLEWKTIFPLNMNSALQKKWEKEENLTREASQIVFSSEEEEMEEF